MPHTQESVNEWNAAYRIGFGSLVASISRRFAGSLLPEDPSRCEDALDRLITNTIRETGEFLEADRGFVILITENGATLSITHEWSTEGVRKYRKRYQKTPFEKFPWIREYLLAFQPVSISDVKDLPPEARLEGYEPEDMGVRSALLVPMVGRGELVGIFGFNMVAEPRVWEPPDTELLQVVGEMIANAFVRCEEMNELHKSEERLRLTLEATADGVWDFDVPTLSVFLSESAARILGVGSTQATFSSAFLRQLIHPDDRKSVSERYHDHKIGKAQRFETEVRMRASEDEWRHIFCRGMIVSWQNGQPTRMLGTMVDVTELQRAERHRKETEQKYRHLFELETDAIFVVDEADDTILEANAATEELYGYSREYLLAMKFGDLIHAPPLNASEKLHASGATLLLQTHTHCDGSAIPVEVSMRRIPWQGKNVRIAAVRDIRERLEAQQAIESQRVFLKAVIDAEPSMIVVYGRDQRTMLVNTAVCRFIGKDEEALLGRRGEELFPSVYSAESFRNQNADLFAGRLERMEYEHKLVDFRGDTRWVWLIRLPLRDSNGHISAILSVGIDLTEEKQLKAELMRTGQLASLGELAAGLAHEINNPVNGIINYAQVLLDMIEDGGMDENAGSRFLSKIITEGERIARLAHGVLGFARSHLDEKPPCHVDEAANSVVELVQSRLVRDGTQLSVHIPSDLPPVSCVAWELQQVLMNLISNAQYALNQRFPAPDPEKRLAIYAAQGQTAEGPTVVISVEDNGPGIQDAHLNDVLDPFFTTKPEGEGTGLGLSICHSIIGEHHGTLEFQKPQQGGTRVVVTLPAKIDSQADAA